MTFVDPNCAIIESLWKITFVQKKKKYIYIYIYIKAVVNPQSSSVIITDKCDKRGV